MSIENIKELFSKRVQESVTFNRVENESTKTTLADTEEEYVSLQETDVGITEYLSDCKGFNAVIKQRFSDFHVHEIDLDGNTVYLTNTDIPVVKEEEIDEEELSSDILEKLKSLNEKVVESVEIDVSDFDKEKRRSIHRAIKSKYGSTINSNTVDKDDKKVLVLSLGKEENRKSPWFLKLGKVLHFAMYKKNLDTADAIGIIATKLRTKASNLTYAGTKDKRANTTQWVSMNNLDANKLNGLNKILRNIRVGNYVYKDNTLQLGDLTGNLFEIALRNVTEEDSVVTEALNTVKENGFINYFGLQRFGNCAEVPTHEIGRALVKGDFKLAVELILKPRKGKMKQDLKDARKVWWETRDAKLAFECLKSKDRTIEGKLLSGLAKHGKNAYVNALDSIPRNVRLLYLHSYQSLIWNKILSKRIKVFGRAVIEGDLVLSNESGCEEVKSISQEEIPKYEIYDIVQPLPGYNVTYPNNVIKTWYEDLLKEDELTSETFKQSVRQYSLSGNQRHIARKLKDLSWRICHYSEPEEDLILSDFDKINNYSLDINKNSDNKYKAVILKFSLDSSTYATMALREILKIDTSASFHTALNTYSNPNKRVMEDDDSECRKKSKV